MLNDGKIKLRALEPTDLDVLYRWENDASLWSVGCAIAPFSRKQLWDYIETYNGDIYSSNQLRFIIEDCDLRQAVGTIDLYDFDAVNRRAFVGILIDAECGHRGYATRALTLLWEYVCERIGMHQLVAVVPVENVYSMKLFEKCGYKRTATLQSWVRVGSDYKDVALFQLISQ